MCWSKVNSAEVARMRATGMTVEKLAKHFKKSIPTIRRALENAAADEPSVKQLPKKIRRSCWAEEHAEEVAALAAGGMSINDLATHFAKTDTTIYRALTHAKVLALLEPLDGGEKQ
jgi:transposase